MPRRSKTGKRRISKPTMRKAKTIIAKQHKRKAAKNMDTFFLKAKNVGAIVPAQGVTVANYVYYSPVLLDSSNTWSVTSNAEFKLYCSMYDKVRVNSIKLTYTPKANVFDAALAQSDSAYTLTGDGAIHTAIDRDSTVPSNVSRISRYPSYRKYSLLKKFSRTYSVRYPTGVWLDCQNIFEDQTLLKRLGLSGSIGLYAENIIEDRGELFNEPLADVLLEYNCVFQGKVGANLSLDDNGNVVVRADTDPMVVAVPTFVTMRGGFQDTRWDLSGNIVPVLDTDLP